MFSQVVTIPDSCICIYGYLSTNCIYESASLLHSHESKSWLISSREKH